jgi:rare lipoprotein A (peptidoglycan hydrolase)
VERRSVRPRTHESALRRPRRIDRGLSGPRPDRVAAWAVCAGIFMVLVASATSKGASGGALEPASGGAALPERSAAPDSAGGRVTDAARREQIARMSGALATWYGPGLYGRRTACGVVLRRSTEGVAHRSLPCGTPVTFYFHGRFVRTRVIDRGPYAAGVSWDLTAATAKWLGLTRTGRIRAGH